MCQHSTQNSENMYLFNRKEGYEIQLNNDNICFI